MTSAVLIIPVAMKSAANAVGEALGWGPDNYTIPLSDNGATITHWACRTDVGEAFKAMLINPPDIPGIADVLAGMIVDLSDEVTNAEHLAAAMASRGLVRV